MVKGLVSGSIAEAEEVEANFPGLKAFHAVVRRHDLSLQTLGSLEHDTAGTVRDNYKTSTLIASSVNMTVDTGSGIVFEDPTAGSTFDNFNDNVINPALWSTATTGEGTIIEQNMQMEMAADSTDGPADTATLTTVTDDWKGKSFAVDFDELNTNLANANNFLRVQLTDGVTTVTLASVDGGTDGAYNFDGDTWRFWFDSVNDKYFAKEATGTAVEVDVSGVTGANTNIIFALGGAGGGGTTSHAFLEIVYEGSGAGTLTSTSLTTPTNTIKDGMFTTESEETGVTVTYTISADGNVNKETVDKDVFHSFVNTGTDFRYEFTTTSSATTAAFWKGIMQKYIANP